MRAELLGDRRRRDVLLLQTPVPASSSLKLNQKFSGIIGVESVQTPSSRQKPERPRGRKEELFLEHRLYRVLVSWFQRRSGLNVSVLLVRRQSGGSSASWRPRLSAGFTRCLVALQHCQNSPYVPVNVHVLLSSETRSSSSPPTSDPPPPPPLWEQLGPAAMLDHNLDSDCEFQRIQSSQQLENSSLESIWNWIRPEGVSSAFGSFQLKHQLHVWSPPPPEENPRLLLWRTPDPPEENPRLLLSRTPGSSCGEPPAPPEENPPDPPVENPRLLLRRTPRILLWRTPGSS
ncbi:unnamed protein product [Pleuronectes platessa]|uniref:Uncharacterized protein n=1 Tax=Pleuronectes platessa TaxID=8262 RepID=A0A9N7YGB7_PLEPL|nr:unnamed protein product [Pleuronectes platessa]